MIISFKSFVEAIHQAITGATDALMDKNRELLEKYFETVMDESEGHEVLTPRKVHLDYPTLDEQGQVVSSRVQVPLITLVPVTASQVEKATLTAEFRLSIANDELFIDFPNEKEAKRDKKENEKTTTGKLEIVISPKETTEGLQQIISAYETLLKRQLS
jgi:hypothetical protein